MSSHRRLLIVVTAVPVCLVATVWAQEARPRRSGQETMTMSERADEFRRTFMGDGGGSQTGQQATQQQSSAQQAPRSSSAASRTALSPARPSTSRSTAAPPRRTLRLKDVLFGSSGRTSSSGSGARRQSPQRQATRSQAPPRQTAGRSATRPTTERQEPAPQTAQPASGSSRRTFQPGYRPPAREPQPLPTLASPPADEKPAPRVASRPPAARRTPTPAPRIARGTDAAARQALREADETLRSLDAAESDESDNAAEASPSRGGGSAALPQAADAGAGADELTVAPNRDEFVVSQRGPELRLETSGPRRLLVGSPADYKVALYNAGEAAATDVAVTIELPDWAEVVGIEATTGQARPVAGAPGAIRWSVAQMSARGRQELKLEIIARQDREFELGVSWTSSPAETMAKIEVRQARLELALTGPKEVSYGAKSIFKLTFSNPGSADAENIVVRLLPLDAESDAVESHKLGNLAAGASKEVELELVARQQGQLEIVIEATADGGLEAAVSEEVLVRRAGLQVAVEAPKFQYSGALTTYHLTVTNPGDEPAQNVRVTARLPRGATYVSSTSAGAHDEAEGQVVWELKTLEAGKRQVLTVRCAPEMSGPNQLTVNVAAEGELTASAVETTEVEATADLALEVRDPGGPMPVDEEVVYEVVVRNRGAKAATDIEIVGFFSTGIDPLKVEGSEYTIEDGKVLFSPLASLAGGEERVYKIKARAHFRGNHVFRAEVHCHSPESALAQEGTTRYYASEEDQNAEPLNTAATRQATRPATRRAAEPAEDEEFDADHDADASEGADASDGADASISTNETPTDEPAKRKPTQFRSSSAQSDAAPAAEAASEEPAEQPVRLGWRPRKKASRASTARQDEKPAR